MNWDELSLRAIVILIPKLSSYQPRSIENVGVDWGGFDIAAIVHSVLISPDESLCSPLKSVYGIEYMAIRSISTGKKT